jgi:cardiolipin synthase
MSFSWAELEQLSEWVIRLVMLVYVPQKRSPSAARAWLLLIFVLPWPGLVLYAIFGRAYLPSKRVQQQMMISQLVRTRGYELLAPSIATPLLPAPFRQAITLATNLGDFPITAGNRIDLLTDYRTAIDRLIEDIRNARQHVHLLYYIFADDQTGMRVIDALGQAVSRGVKCRVLIDSLGSRPWLAKVRQQLAERGVEVTPLLPVRILRFHREAPRLDLRNHRKIAVIDGRVGYVGSQNLVNADFKRGIIYKELVARVTGPVVLEMQAVLLTDRYLEGLQNVEDPSFFPHQEHNGNSFAQVLPSGPGYPQANNQRLIVALMHAAQKRVVVTTPYFVPDEALLQAMETAVQRGVEVHLVVSKKADQVLVGFGQRAYYDVLLEAGVQIHQFRDGLLHAKHVSFDDTVAIIGSSNLDIRSFNLNAEISLIVYDPEVVARLSAEQERNIADSDTLSIEEWAERPFLMRVAQNLAKLFDSLL